MASREVGMVGATFGSYRVVRKLGEGGMGEVYLAEHPLLKRKAVVKLLLPAMSSNADLVNRFFNEARAATSIKHVGIVDVFDFGFHASGRGYIVMEYLQGESLAAAVRRTGRFAPDVALVVARQVANAVGAAHEAGVVHRDLKPDNLFLVPDVEAPLATRVKVLDFGIAKLVSDRGEGSLRTRTGSVIGTPTYMAPEQCRGSSRTDGRADVYALGCILFELLTGRVPFTGEGLGEIIAMHIYEEPPAPSSLAPVSPEIERLILTMMAKHPDDRPPRMRAVVDAIDAITNRAHASAPMPAQPAAEAPTVMATPPTVLAASTVPTTLSGATGEAGPGPPAPPKRRRALLAGAAVAAIAVAAGVMFVSRGPAGSGAPQPGAASAPVSASAPAPVPVPVPVPVVAPVPVAAPVPTPVAVAAPAPAEPKADEQAKPKPKKRSRGRRPTVLNPF